MLQVIKENQGVVQKVNTRQHEWKRVPKFRENILFQNPTFLASHIKYIKKYVK